jgi:hypothetical protein
VTAAVSANKKSLILSDQDLASLHTG